MRHPSQKFLKALSYSLAALLLTLVSTTLLAQTFRGGINGTVIDKTGASISGASITAVETSPTTAINAVSTSAGEFSFTNLTVGTYTVTVTATGFSSTKYDKVQVEAGSATSSPRRWKSPPPPRPSRSPPPPLRSIPLATAVHRPA